VASRRVDHSLPVIENLPGFKAAVYAGTSRGYSGLETPMPAGSLALTLTKRSRVASGAGMGLSLGKCIANAHGGLLTLSVLARMAVPSRSSSLSNEMR